MEKKKINRNEKHIMYMRLLNTKEWRELRAWKIDSCDGKCERCRQEGIETGVQCGYIRAAKTVHHIRPVENGADEAEMRALCFDRNNLMLLCPECHHKIHEEMKSHQGQIMRTIPKEAQKANDHIKAWAARHGDPNYQPPQKPRKGIRKTFFGWMTKDEYKQKQEEQLEEWKRRQDKHDITGTKATPRMDAGAED